MLSVARRFSPESNARPRSPLSRKDRVAYLSSPPAISVHLPGPPASHSAISEFLSYDADDVRRRSTAELLKFLSLASRAVGRKDRNAGRRIESQRGRRTAGRPRNGLVKQQHLRELDSFLFPLAPPCQRKMRPCEDRCDTVKSSRSSHSAIYSRCLSVCSSDVPPMRSREKRVWRAGWLAVDWRKHSNQHNCPFVWFLYANNTVERFFPPPCFPGCLHACTHARSHACLLSCPPAAAEAEAARFRHILDVRSKTVSGFRRPFMVPTPTTISGSEGPRSSDRIHRNRLSEDVREEIRDLVPSLDTAYSDDLQVSFGSLGNTRKTQQRMLPGGSNVCSPAPRQDGSHSPDLGLSWST